MALTKFQRLMMINAHPIKFWANIIGGLITLYFLWKHDLFYALLLGGLIIFGGTFFTTKYSKLSLEEIAGTRLGNLFRHYTTPLGFTCYCISHIIIPVSFWYHELILFGIGIVFLMMGLFNRVSILNHGNNHPKNRTG